MKKSGFRVEAARLAMADSMERLKFGNKESAESKAEARDIATSQDRQAIIERLKLAAGGKPSLTPPTNVETSVPASVLPTNSSGVDSVPSVGGSSNSPLASTTSTPDNSVGILDSEAAKESRSNDRRKEMRAALDKLTGGDQEAGNLQEQEAKDAKLAERKRLADLLKANAGVPAFKEDIAAIDKARGETQALLKSFEDRDADRAGAAKITAGLNQPANPLSTAPLKTNAPSAVTPVSAYIPESVRNADDSYGKLKITRVEPYVGPMGDRNSAKDQLAALIRDGYTGKQARAMLGDALAEEAESTKKKRPNKRVFTPQLPMSETFENTGYGAVANWFNTKVK